MLCTAVAASTHDRTLSARFSVSGSDFVGASVNRKGVGPAPAVLAVAAAKEGANLTEANLCYANTLNPALVTGKIVVGWHRPLVRTNCSLTDAENFAHVL